MLLCVWYFFFFNDTATTEIYTLSLHDALPISNTFGARVVPHNCAGPVSFAANLHVAASVSSISLIEYPVQDRKSTRLNSSHANISYAVFCLKKKTQFEVTHKINIQVSNVYLLL